MRRLSLAPIMKQTALTRSLLAIAFLGLMACGGGADTNTENGSSIAAAPANDEASETPNSMDNTSSAKPGEGLFAHIRTNMGEIVIQLEYQRVPMTVANFVGLAEGKVNNTAKPEGTPYYDGLIFHRVIPGFMIQGGDPTGTGAGSPGYAFADEIDPGLRHDRPGALSMANSGPNTNGSQFFITHGPTPHLDGRHAVFGYVVKGQDVVDAIGNVPRGPRDRPLEDVRMEQVTIERVGADAQAWDATEVLKQYADKFRAR